MAERELPRQFGTLDAVFLNFERKEMPLHIGAVAICDGKLDFERFVAGIESRLDLIPRYRQKVARSFLNIGLPSWQDDPHFDIRRHILRVNLEAPGGEAQLRALTGRIFTPLLDRGKPLWEVYIVDGLSGERSAIIAKVHHCMVDGVAGVGLLNLMFDPSPEVPPLPKKKRYRPAPPPEMPAPAQLLTDALAGTLKFTVDQLAGVRDNLMSYGMMLFYDEHALPSMQRLAGALPEMLGPLERLPFNRPCSGERQVAWSEYSFTDARAIRSAHGGSVNDVVLTIYTGALMRYLKLHRESTRNRFVRIMVPVNLRALDDRGMLGNRISMLPVALPLYIKDPIARLKHITGITRSMKHAHVAELIRAGVSWLGVLPPPIQALAGGLPLWSTPVPIVHTISTNVPGPQVPLYANGRRLLTLYPHVPAGWDVGLCLAIQSYDQKLFFGLTIDAQAAPDGARMKDFMDASFAELRKAAKIPGAEPRVRRKRQPKPAPPPAAEPPSEPSAPPAPEMHATQAG
jgi:diacylglycerol O-acyltransferase / wax synthase